MKNFFKKYKEDKKYKNKVNLVLSTIFVVIVTIYAISSLDNIPANAINTEIDATTEKDIINIKDEFHYTTSIEINNETYKYLYDKTSEGMKIINLSTTPPKEYKYENNEYYQLEDNKYILTNKSEVYDKINYNYIDLKTIKKYLSVAEENNNQYLVYLKDVLLGEETEEYFTITLSTNQIIIDYTPLIKKFNSETTKYNVKFFIESGIEIIKN